jgi:hypothetical protein
VTQPTGTLIGFDFGERRIGVAVGETGTGIANPRVRSMPPPTTRAFARSRSWSSVAPRGIRGGPPAPRGRFEHAVAKLAEIRGACKRNTTCPW